MGRRVLVTGGAGFIGSHLCARLLLDGYDVRVLDNLCPQVHGAPRARLRPLNLSDDVEVMIGDVRDPRACGRALDGVDLVCHLAARVGVGQSMYEIAEYASVNTWGTATLLEAIVRRPIERLVVASSMSVYGEGAYVDEAGTPRRPVARTADQLRNHDWELRDADGRPLHAVATAEWQPTSVDSVYALSKLEQERLCLMLGQAYGIETTALRLFNVYGPHQPLTNPPAGVMSIFSTRLLNESAPLINEDGLQRRDFVNVRDVAEAFSLALRRPDVAGQIFNVGSGSPVTIRELAELVAAALGRAHVAPSVTGQHRPGDVRHCFADLENARDVLGFAPRVTLTAGLAELAAWLSATRARELAAVTDLDRARRQLGGGGLTL
jgi:dTDP-L-rhamnose 4-epimerase